MVMRAFFGEPVICPRCLRKTRLMKRDIPVCSDCQYHIPKAYIDVHKHAPPLFVQVFGWSNHGKTMFLDVLRLMLYEAHHLWPHYQYSPLTEADFNLERELRRERAEGVAPQSTQFKERNQNEVFILHLQHIERWGSRSMVIMDHPGEMFQQFGGVPAEEMPFLLGTPTTFMVVSLPDMVKGETVDQLLSIYIDTMNRYGLDFRRHRKNLVVVLTKADMINQSNHLPDLPPNLYHYLTTDDTWERIYNPFQNRRPPYNAYQMVEHVERMQRVSDEIRDWLQYVPGGVGFVRRLESNLINARFSLITPTGRDIDNATPGSVMLTPRRVLDPFYWALELQPVPMG